MRVRPRHIRLKCRFHLHCHERAFSEREEVSGRTFPSDDIEDVCSLSNIASIIFERRLSFSISYDCVPEPPVRTTTYSWICRNSGSVAVQITSWQVATRQTSEPLLRAYTTSSIGNSLSCSLSHFGHTTGNWMAGSIITHLPSCVDIDNTSEKWEMIPRRLTKVLL